MPTGALPLLLAAIALALSVGGCRKPAEPAQVATTASAPCTLPASAPTDPDDESAMEIIIKNDPRATSRHAPTYTRDEQVASGSLRGAVRFAPPLARGQMPSPKPVDVAAVTRQPAAG